MQKTRKIPAVMFSQHPDHASKPYWHDKAFIEAHHELKECYLMFNELGAQEVMWDWEGKLVDEAVIERLLGKHANFFQENQLGRDLFLTFRVPNPRLESGYRLGRAFMVILSAQHFAKTLGFASAPLFEVILPMTQTHTEIIELQKSFRRLSKASAYSFGSNEFTSRPLEVIPLFETVETILKSKKILEIYVQRYQKQFGEKPSYLRPFLARSDPALNSGIIPTTLAIKWALSEYAKFTDETKIESFPILAPGALPFRGGLTPETGKFFMEEFQGLKTVVIQSSFRYDYPKEKVKRGLDALIKEIQNSEPEILPDNFLTEIQAIIPWFEKPYKKTVEELAPLINNISFFLPQRRERVQHIGLFGYSREMGKVKLPRAIGFTASCYSLGIPPELFGVGHGLLKAKKEDKLKTIERLYKNLKTSLITAGRYLRKESLDELGLDFLKDEIKIVEEYLGETLGPLTKEEIQHQKLVAQIISLVKKGKKPKEEIEKAVILRKSLG